MKKSYYSPVVMKLSYSMVVSWGRKCAFHEETDGCSKSEFNTK